MDSTHELDSEQTVAARAAMVDRLLEQEMVTDPVVERAFRTVPRHAFVPVDTSVEAAYSADDSVVTKRDDAENASSSVSAPFIQARMIEMAGLCPGSRVVEIGSGGYNAALLAEVVGASGQVVSIDIDPEVTSAAQENLKATGYGDRVSVWCSDATGDDLPLPNHTDEAGESEGWDAVLVTVGVADIARTWIESLAPEGRIVVPLRMNGITRVIAFTRDQHRGRLVSVDNEIAGFVPAQGTGLRPELTVRLDGPGEQVVELRFDSDGPAQSDRLRRVLDSEPDTVWSKVTMGFGVSFVDLHLWLACFLPGFCRVATGEGTTLLGQVGTDWFPFATATEDGFAVLAVRNLSNNDDQDSDGDSTGSAGGVEFGARAYGPGGHQLATALADQTRAWDALARHAPGPRFEFCPIGSPPAVVTERAAALPTPNGTVIVSWPTG